MASRVTKSPGKPGRPSKFTPALVDDICERISVGESLRKICEPVTMPHRATVLRWLIDDEEFATKYARAREAQADFLDEEMQEIADAATVENVQVAKLKIETRRWRASKLAPKRYGDKVQAEVSGPNGAPLGVIERVIVRPDDPNT